MRRCPTHLHIFSRSGDEGKRCRIVQRNEDWVVIREFWILKFFVVKLGELGGHIKTRVETESTWIHNPQTDNKNLFSCGDDPFLRRD